MSENWIAASWDRLSSGRQILLGIEQWIFREKSPYQDIAIARVPELGRGLFLDGNVQFLEADEFVYHEHLVVPPLLYHPSPKNVLIAGGGDGLALRELLRDSRVEEAVLVELDEVVINACREHLPDLHRGSFDDTRARVHVGDVVEYLTAEPRTFDIILADLIDAFDEGALALYDKVLPLTKKSLSPGGIVCMFGELAHPSYGATPLYVGLARSFRYVEIHRVSIDSFSSDYGFILASDEIDFRHVPTTTLTGRAALLSGASRSVVPEKFPSEFLLPPYLRKHLDKALDNATYAPEPTGETMSWIYPERNEP
jgi:spermidine synthase